MKKNNILYIALVLMLMKIPGCYYQSVDNESVNNSNVIEIEEIHKTSDDDFGAWYQANTGDLWNSRTGNAGLGMMAGTNPCPDGKGGAWFQANTGDLWNTRTGNAGLGMMKGTSPCSDGKGGAWYQANTGFLWNSRTGNTGLGMMKGTSPCSDGKGGAWYQANTGDLWNSRTGNTGFGMMKRTSPSSDGKGGAWFQANTGFLWNTRLGDLRLGMKAGTSPSADEQGGAWYQANTGNLWNTRIGDLHLGMRGGTSPAADGEGGAWFQANTGNLWNTRLGDLHLGMKAKTSPSSTSDLSNYNYGASIALYTSEHAAAQAAIAYNWEKSRSDKVEYGGVIYKINNTNLYGFVSTRGENKKINTDVTYPAKSKVVALWHTHPNYASIKLETFWYNELLCEYWGGREHCRWVSVPSHVWVEVLRPSNTDINNMKPLFDQGISLYTAIFVNKNSSEVILTKASGSSSNYNIQVTDRKPLHRYLDDIKHKSESHFYDFSERKLFEIDLDEQKDSGTFGSITLGPYNVKVSRSDNGRWNVQFGKGMFRASTSGKVGMSASYAAGGVCASTTSNVSVPDLFKKGSNPISVTVSGGTGAGAEVNGIGAKWCSGRFATFDLREEDPNTISY